jgi:anaerobic dimethyl sulfoxide reductase subunit B (iron-sulfur subunit)
MYKEEKYGAVLIDPDKATDAKLKAAWQACPYGAIVFDSDETNAKASKCTMCIDRLEQGMLPVCVLACPMRALDFGPINSLQIKYETSNRDLEDVPNSAITNPAVIFKAHEAKKKLIPYDATKALELMAKRPRGLPPVYSSPSNVTEIPDGIVGRGKLIIKPKNTNELMLQTQDDNS